MVKPDISGAYLYEETLANKTFKTRNSCDTLHTSFQNVCNVYWRKTLLRISLSLKIVQMTNWIHSSPTGYVECTLVFRRNPVYETFHAYYLVSKFKKPAKLPH